MLYKLKKKIYINGMYKIKNKMIIIITTTSITPMRMKVTITPNTY
jgi:hypothetical protein